MKVLLTGFDPFGGESVNPAFEAIKLLPSTIAGAEIVYVEIPTEFKKSAPAVEAAIKEHNPGGRCTPAGKRGYDLPRLPAGVHRPPDQFCRNGPGCRT